MGRSTRIFVTGLGMISPAGAGAAPFWDDLCAARIRFTELDPLYAGMKPGALGGRVPPEARETALAQVGEQTRARPRAASLFAEYAALEALRDAGLDRGDDALRDAIVCVGSSDGQADALEDLVGGRRGVTETGGFSSYSITEGVAMAVGARGPAFTTQSTCASANVAVSCAMEMLRSGVAGTAVVGGCDPYSQKNIIGFSSLQAIGATRCRPFSVDRRYVTPSEGAGILVLQTEEALRPGQRPYAEILATAITNDANHPTAPDRDGVEACHLGALAEAGITADDVDVIFAHGTGSRANDSVEGGIIAENYPRAAVTAIKGTVGHLMGAAGAAGAVAACLTMRHRLVPPTAVDAAEVEGGLNLVTGAPLAMPRLRHVQNNAFGFGGNNAISVFRNVA
ncbi:beta-ketoacyl synthase N-terminal-like domain-containing protein [Micromonospora sp. WMMD882]|uniref:beta-ketoacyl synthase N-terminal-like domain-containing protein n=1 Tax=Micromonospora sp. WMMD882 TaxID=3015151 RepID=UPI00248B3D37|nr:beta-ketoacyl synthase N-terminal-like domain-containing protein [Micromonospora sp. WMMD882]WBB77734.1 beta-ketoacyl synthase N-terminal-like domain-containing protein [Micromonospora sp. WMMD882]